MNKKIAILLLAAIQIVMIVLFSVLPYEYSQSTLGWMLIIALGVYVIFYGVKETNTYVRRQFFLPSKIFLFAFAIVYFQNYIDAYFEYGDLYHPLSILYPDSVVRSATISISALICFCLGYHISPEPISLKKTSRKVYKYTPLTILKLATAGLLLLYYLTGGSAMLQGGYGAEEVGGLNGFAGYFLEGSIYAVLILHSLNIKKKEQSVSGLFAYIMRLGWFNFIILAYFAIILLFGDRGPLIYITLAYLLTYVYTTGVIYGIVRSFVLILIAGFAMTILGVARNMGEGVNKAQQVELALEVIGAKEKTSFFLPTKELANSVRCLHAVVDEQENHVDFEYSYGRYSSYLVLTSLPFMGTLVAQSGLYDGNETQSTEYMTNIIQGRLPQYGDGTAAVAEFYLEFGLIGVCVGMLLCGLFFRRIDLLGDSSTYGITIFMYAMLVAYFSYSVYLPRSTMFFPLKKAFVAYIISAIYIFFMRTFAINTKSE